MTEESRAPFVVSTRTALLPLALAALAACQAPATTTGAARAQPATPSTPSATRGAPLGAPLGAPSSDPATRSSSTSRRGAPLGAPPVIAPSSQAAEQSPNPADRSFTAAPLATQDPFADPLRKVVVPGGTTSIYDAPGRKVDPLLSPNSRPGPWQDHPELAKRCTKGAIDRITGVPSTLPLNTEEVGQVLDNGTTLAKLRHEHAFEVSRFNAQQEKIAGWGARLNRTAPEGARRVPRPERTGTIVDRIPQAQDDLAYNQAVLQRREAELRQREAAYVEQLAQAYQSTVTRIISASPQTTSLDSLNRLDALRFEIVIPCLMRAQGQVDEAVAVRKTRNQELAPFSQLVLVRERAAIAQRVRAAKSTTELMQAVQALLPSPRLLELAQLDPEINGVLKERGAALDKQEALARETAQREAALAQAQQQQAQRQEFLARAEKNVAPSPTEVLRLFRDASMRASSRNYARVTPIGDNAFETIKSTLLGEIKSGEFVLDVRDVTCKPVQRKQLCSLVEQSYQRLFSVLGTSRTTPGQTDKLQIEFHWTVNGLQSNYTPWVIETVRASAGSSSITSQADRQREDDLHQMRREIYDMNRELQRRREER